MANNVLTPLQLTAAYGLGSNTALTLPTNLLAAYSAFDAIPVIVPINQAIYNTTHAGWASDSTKQSLQNITGTGNACPALGNAQSPMHSLVNYYQTRQYPGMTGYMHYLASLYIGDETGQDESSFCQGFMAAVNYCDSINRLINSAVNAQTYLGPTFPGMDNLVTNNIAGITNSKFSGFATDLANQGQLTDFADLDIYGTPAALLRQIARVANINGDTLLILKTPLLATGLSALDIRNLIVPSTTISQTQFNQLQRLAYQGMTQVTGADLQQVLTLLDITTVNIQNMAELLDQKKIFPNSYKDLQTFVPGTGNTPQQSYVPIYRPDGTVNMAIQPNMVDVTGCEELGKIIPPDQAVANKAVQSAFQQITGIQNTTPARLAQAIMGQSSSVWNVQREYLAATVVQHGSPIPTQYQAQQTVPPGIDINNTAYWLPTTLGGLNTMAGLPLIQSQTAAINSSVQSFYSAKATGSGPNGTITVSDVAGSMWGYNVLTALASATAAIAAIDSAGGTVALTDIYTRMQNVSDGTYGDPTVGPVTVPAGAGAGVYANGDAALLALIPLANTEVATVATNYSSLSAVANSDFDQISQQLWGESQYQAEGSINFALYEANNQPSVTAFVQSLPNYGTQTAPNGPAYFLNQIADIATLGGQAVIGVMREGQNNQRLAAGALQVNVCPSADPSIPPVPAVTPVY